ncbi:hypothetical protein [Arthrobacter sp. NA-172]|uniref:hypothetical protein n=1 Tax=Arthrobacter sp. NA-172 TaxID=3367524 RepID=UPI0037548AD5
MSNPPYPPSSPGTPDEKPTPEQPQYGQQTPQYGQPSAPQYGQKAPQFGQQAPQYGQQTPPQAPQYGQQAPQYGQQTPPQAPQYGQQAPQAPQYGQQAPQYGQQAPQYGQQAPGQQPQYGQPSVPQYGQGGPWPSQQPTTTSGVPKLVNISFWLIIAAGVLTLIGIPFSIASLNSAAGKGMIDQALAAQGANTSGVDTASVIGVIVTVMVIFSVIFAGLYALVAFKVRKGKNWARILGTVFAAISLLGLTQIGMGTITILLGIAAMVMLYLPASAPYFRKAQPFANPYNQAPYGR